MDPQLLLNLYTKNYMVIIRHTDELSHDDSLLQFAFGGNSLNWTLGHITATRSNILAMLGEKDTVWGFAQAKRYIPGSPPVTDGMDVLRLENILTAFSQTQLRLTDALMHLPAGTLDKPYADGTIGAALAFYATHEAYHAGQLELCRRLAGHLDTVDFR